MKFPTPKTLGGATSPIILTNWIFGIGIFEHPIGRPRPVISLCWSIALLCLFAALVAVAESRNLTQLHISTVSIGVYHFFMFTTVVSVILFICVGRTTLKTVSASIRKLNTVNKMMSKYEIFKEYRSTFKYQIIQMIGALICISVMVTCNLALFVQGYHFHIADICYLAAVHYVPTYSFIIDCTFATFIRYIGKLFQHLNTNFIRCSSQENNTNSFFQGFELDDSLRSITLEIHGNPYSFMLAEKLCMMHLIRNSRKIHQELCNTARALNEAFGVQILLSITNSSILITTSLYSVYTSLTSSTSTSASISILNSSITISWFIYYTAKILIVVFTCSMTFTQAQRMGELIHRLDKPTADRQVREEIRAFSLLLMQNPLQFTACGFFTLDFEMICNMVGAVTTYLVIMIQLHKFYDPESKLPNDTPCATNTTY